MAVSSEAAIQISANQRQMAQLAANADRDVARIGANAARRASSDAARAEMWSSMVSSIANAGVAAMDNYYKLKTQTAALELGKQQLGYQFEIDKAKMQTEVLKTAQTLQAEQLRNAQIAQTMQQQKFTFDATQNGLKAGAEIQMLALQVATDFGSAITPAQYEAASAGYRKLNTTVREIYENARKNGTPLVLSESAMSTLTALQTLANQKSQVDDIPIFGSAPRNQVAMTEIAARAQNKPSTVSIRDYQDLILMASRGSSTAQEALRAVNSEIEWATTGSGSELSVANAQLFRLAHDRYTIFQTFGGDKASFDAWDTGMKQRYGTVSLAEYAKQIHSAAVEVKSGAGGTTGTTSDQIENPNAAQDISALAAKAAEDVARSQKSAVLGLDITPEAIGAHKEIATRLSGFMATDINRVVMGESQAVRDAAAARVKATESEKIPGMSYFTASSGVIPAEKMLYKGVSGAVPLTLPPDRALGIRFPILTQYAVAGGGSMLSALQTFVNSNESALAGRSAADRVKLFVDNGVSNGTLTRSRIVGGNAPAYAGRPETTVTGLPGIKEATTTTTPAR